jgi:transposase
VGSFKRVNAVSTLWEQVGVTDVEIDVNYHCYEAMDKLFARQPAIQKSLAKKHLKDGVLILYDMTSTYFEGEYEDSEIVEFGYNRDRKKGKEQITIGLLCGGDGCPVAVKVFRGHEKDASTVNEEIELIKREFGLKDIVFVGDRGMITKARLSDMEPGKEHEMLKISALTHARIKKLCKDSGHVQLSMFDEAKPIEVVLPENPTMRYALCLNPVRAEKETASRRSMVDAAKAELDKIATPKKDTDDGTLGQRVGKIFTKRQVRKFFDIKIKDGKITYTVNEAKIADEELYDGHYVIFTDVDKEQMDINEVVDSYRALANVEQAFENLKSPKLELRPVYHKTDERINCHVFLCMLAYYLLWHMKQRLKPLFDNDCEGRKRRYTMEFIIELLKNIQKQLVEFNSVQTYFTSELSDEQQKIFDLLNIKLA